MTATWSAIRTSQTGKRQALRNAVLNAALPGAPDITQQRVFLQLTDRFTELHLFVLALFQSPGGRVPTPVPAELQTPGLATSSSLYAGRPDLARTHSTGLRILHAAVPDASEQFELYNKIWADLYAEKLVKTPEIDNGAEGDWRAVKRTTAFGDAYLAFISEPESP